MSLFPYSLGYYLWTLSKPSHPSVWGDGCQHLPMVSLGLVRGINHGGLFFFLLYNSAGGPTAQAALAFRSCFHQETLQVPENTEGVIEVEASCPPS